MTSLERGLYEVLITEVLEKQLGGLDAALEPIRSALRAPEAADRIALHLARVIERAVNSIAEGERTNAGLDLARRLIDLIRELPSAADFGAERPVAAGDVLQSVAGRLPDGRPDTLAAPMIPLLDATLLTNAAVFESYWHNPDFEDYDRDVFLARTAAEHGGGPIIVLSPTELRPEPFQERLLEQIALARLQGHHRNLGGATRITPPRARASCCSPGGAATNAPSTFSDRRPM